MKEDKGVSKLKNIKFSKERILFGISILFVLFTAIPLIWACWYAVPSADDFFGAITVRKLEQEGMSPLLVAWEAMVSRYFNHQGTFTGWFFHFLFSTFTKAQIIPTRVTLFIITILFLTALYFCVYSFMRHILRGGGYNILINVTYGLIIYVITIGHNVQQIFYWICGAFMYTVPLIFMLAGFGFVVRAIEENKKTYILLAAFLCGLSTGGTLQIAALTNVVLLGIGLWEYRRRRSLIILPAFLCTLLGAVINAVAPGNFIRHETIGSELNILHAIKNSIIAIKISSMSLIRNSPLLLIVVICVFIGTLYTGNKIYEMIGVIVYSAIGLIVIDFPVVLAYGRIYLEPRVVFLQNMAIVLAAMICSICIGQAIACISRNRQMSGRAYGITGTVACVSTIMLMISGIYGRNDIIPLAIYINMANGNMREFDEEHWKIFDLLEQGEDQDVIIEYYPSDMGILQSMWLEPDVNSWTNQGIAEWFGCDTVVLKE